VKVSKLDDILVPVKPRYATDEEILRFHTTEYLDRVKRISSAPIGGQVGHELHISHGGFDIASLSLGGVLAAVEDVMAGKVQNAYTLVRPPGHHAEADSGHGFCLFSNVSLAAAHAIAKLGAKRVAIVDWDVHHGGLIFALTQL
jgi:acetoin utilization deacetylase AcuC-like enzyme